MSFSSLPIEPPPFVSIRLAMFRPGLWVLAVECLLSAVFADTVLALPELTAGQPPARLLPLWMAVVAGTAASLALPVLPEDELLAARSLALARGAWALALVGGPAAVTGAVLLFGGAASPGESVRNLLGLTGLALLCAAMSSRLAAIAPILYALAALVAGYDAIPGQASVVRDWAFLAAPVGQGWIVAAALAVGGVVVQAGARPRPRR